jgi:ribosome-binding factor A
MNRSPRLRRVDSTLHHEIADIVGGLKDPRLGFVTITGVETSPDLRTARVYYSVLGSQEQHEACAKGLAAATGHIRGEVGHRVRLKYTPALVFVPDKGVEEGARLTKLLREIGHEEDAS